MPASKSSSSPTRNNTSGKATGTKKGNAVSGIAEDLVNRILKTFDAVLLSRERIQETLDEAAEHGRVTRSDANELAAELFKRGWHQTDDLLVDVEKLVGRGRHQIESATRRARDPVDRLVRSADRARRSSGPALPILGYDDLTAGAVQERLKGLTPAQLRKVREYERRHANRKSVLAAVEKALD